MLTKTFQTVLNPISFEGSFGAVMRNGTPPLPGILQMKIAEIFLGEDETKIREFYEWAHDNYDCQFDEVDVSYMKYIIDQVMAPNSKSKILIKKKR